jgi:UDP-N-acetyl-D-glucosamine dehydrogenase
VPTPLRKTRTRTSRSSSRRCRDRRYLHAAAGHPRSTTYRTPRGRAPALEAAGLEVGQDFCLAFSPERIDPGNANFNTRNIPKVVGGVTPHCTEVAKTLYEQCVERVVPVSSTRVAEMVKLLENTFRSVNIGLVNEIALMCSALRIDVWEVIDAAKTKPFGFMASRAGPRRHCIPTTVLPLVGANERLRAPLHRPPAHQGMPRFVVEDHDALNCH